MATELPPVTIATPAQVSTVTTTVKRSWKGRLVSAAMFVGTFFLGLLQQIGTINLQSLGFTPTQAAWAAAGIFLLTWVLLQFFSPIRVVDTKVEPGAGGQD